MKKIPVKAKITIWFFSLLFSSHTAVFAQNDSQPKIPEGMEAISIGGSAQLIVPKGAKTRKVGAQIIVEGTKEYMSRRFEETEERFIKLEASIEELKKEVQSLQESLRTEDLPQKEQPAQVGEKAKPLPPATSQ